VRVERGAARRVGGDVGRLFLQNAVDVDPVVRRAFLDDLKRLILKLTGMTRL